MEPDYDFEAQSVDITNSMQLVIDEYQNSGKREHEYVKGFSATIINLVVQLLNAKGFERNEIIQLVNDEADA